MKTLHVILLLVFSFLVPAVPSANAAELGGTVRLIDGKGRPVRGAEQAVVSFIPASPTSPGAPEEHRLVTARKQFQPRVLAIPLGSTVAFPNSDPILHNVFSVSGENRFDLGLYRKGEGKSYTFEHPGVVRVFCNVHHEMVAHVLVLETPYFVQPDENGAFRLEGLPEGPGILRVWHERGGGEMLEQRVDLPTANAVEVRVEASKTRIPRHMNSVSPTPREAVTKPTTEHRFDPTLGTRIFLMTTLVVVVAVGVALAMTAVVGGRIAEEAVEQALERSGSVQAAFQIFQEIVK